MSNASSINIHQATIAEIEEIVPLFDAYRQFYNKPRDAEACRAFLLERFKYNQSVIFLARDTSGNAVGFTQLYPSFSSGALGQIFILNDLFVMSSARRQGAGRMLLQAATRYAQATGAIRLTLLTEVTNELAQKLYEAEGWNRDHTFYVYHFPLKS
ncbi:MAG TPA: GNAT family N-acetyltransferase [Blastocatellia bacterium]|nr:GNAT family N-acetyltransferase [Blastocatellia bacterium]